MGSDILGYLIDPGRTISKSTKMLTGKSVENWVDPEGNLNEHGPGNYAAAANPVGTTASEIPEEEAKAMAGSKAYRLATYFTSPTGVLNSSSRRGSKLISA